MQMVRDVSTRWNSTAELIQRALELKDALNILVIKAEHNRPRGVRLQRFRLTQVEWTLLAELSPLLEVRYLIYQPLDQSFNMDDGPGFFICN